LSLHYNRIHQRSGINPAVAAAIAVLGAGQPGQTLVPSSNPPGFMWVNADVDDAEIWKPNTPYTADQIFSFSTANTTAESIDGVELEPGKTYLGKYATAKTSNGTLTNAEIALIEIVSGGNDGILYFGGWLLAEEYPVDALVHNNGKLYVANDYIPVGTAFVVGTTGQTWMLVGGDTATVSAPANGSSIAPSGPGSTYTVDLTALPDQVYTLNALTGVDGDLLRLKVIGATATKFLRVTLPDGLDGNPGPGQFVELNVGDDALTLQYMAATTEYQIISSHLARLGNTSSSAAPQRASDIFTLTAGTAAYTLPNGPLTSDDIQRMTVHVEGSSDLIRGRNYTVSGAVITFIPPTSNLITTNTQAQVTY